MASDGSDQIVWHRSAIPRDERWTSLDVRGAVLWFTGLSGSGKSTIAVEVEKTLVAAGQPVLMLDGDNVRHGLNADLGFSADDRTENIRRVAHVAALVADAGMVAIVPVISPYRAGRDAARSIAAAADVPFLEVFVDTPIEECERRDPKGLYKMARAGEITGFTGIDDPYEEPLAPELHLRPSGGGPDELAAAVVERWSSPPS